MLGVIKINLRIAATIPLTSGEIWYKKLKETVENAQMQPVWMSETKVCCVFNFTRTDHLLSKSRSE